MELSVDVLLYRQILALCRWIPAHIAIACNHWLLNNHSSLITIAVLEQTLGKSEDPESPFSFFRVTLPDSNFPQLTLFPSGGD